MDKEFLPADTQLPRKQNDTRDGLDIAGQNPDQVQSYVEKLTQGLELISEVHDELHCNADLYVAVWDRLSSRQRSFLRAIISGMRA